MKLGGVPRGGFHVLSLAFCAAFCLRAGVAEELPCCLYCDVV